MLEDVDFSKYQSWSKDNKYTNSLRSLHKNYLPLLFINSDERAQEQVKLLSQSMDALCLPLSKLVSGSKEHKTWEVNQRSYQKYQMALLLISDQLNLVTIASLCFPFYCNTWAKQVLIDGILELIKKEMLTVDFYPWHSEQVTLNITAQPYINNINSLSSNKERTHKLLELPEFLVPYTQINLDDFLKASDCEPNLKACAKIWADYLYKPVVPELYLSPAFSDDSLETINEAIYSNQQLIDNTPDGLPIPWLFKDYKSTPNILGQALEAAYRLHREKHRANPTKPQDLLKFFNPKDLKDFIIWRNNQTTDTHVRLKLIDNRLYDYDKFRQLFYYWITI
jgi:hypothetical protein